MLHETTDELDVTLETLLTAIKSELWEIFRFKVFWRIIFSVFIFCIVRGIVIDWYNLFAIRVILVFPLSKVGQHKGERPVDFL